MAAKDNKHRPGAAERAAARGLTRGGGEVTSGPPDAFCVIDGRNAGDLSEAKIRALYPCNPWAQAVIGAVIDVHRAGEPAPEYFWHRCRDGIQEAVRYADLGEGKDGVRRLPIIDGRHRKDAVIKVNAERAGTSEPEPRALPSLILPLPKDPERAAEIVRRFKRNGNIHVPMSPSSNADRILEAVLAGDSVYVAAVKIGIRKEDADKDGARLLALSGCCREVQVAVDERKIEIAEIESWRKPSGEYKKTDDEQREWLAVRLAPKVKKERAPYGSKRKAQPAVKDSDRPSLPWSQRQTGDLADRLASKGHNVAASLIRLLGGDFSDVDELDRDLVEVLESFDVPTIAPEDEAAK